MPLRQGLQQTGNLFVRSAVRLDDIRGRLRIRLLGIDSPETKKPGYSVGCWGPEASEFAKSTLLGQRVAVVTDPSQGMYDRYGRT